ncbi:hypothetical protein L6452_43176 [Arctium lappa]|uniref:Uncharacterized protein n=1 Tax=Arctium lappa TaxID=4217 RepID=A0ACB8XPE1_ARCLA|nr:hypothetical protein L6452_43176 [Arctium lappa]
MWWSEIKFRQTGCSYSLWVDESSITGKSDHYIDIDAIRYPFLRSGSDGNGQMLVISITAWGKIMSSNTTVLLIHYFVINKKYEYYNKDKTGFLTLNVMKVTKFWFGLDQLIIEDDDDSYKSVDPKLLHQGVGLNTTGSVYKSSVPGTESEYCGSPTEKSLLSWAVTSLGMDIEK